MAIDLKSGKAKLWIIAGIALASAVAYSAGIDYFFRGQLEITLPDEGVYSLVDHRDFSGEGPPATDAVSGFKGFKTIKLKLRNVTPDIAPSGGGTIAPQTMPGGNLVAVLKFTRNLCAAEMVSGASTRCEFPATNQTSRLRTYNHGN